MSRGDQPGHGTPQSSRKRSASQAGKGCPTLAAGSHCRHRGRLLPVRTIGRRRSARGCHNACRARTAHPRLRRLQMTWLARALNPQWPSHTRPRPTPTARNRRATSTFATFQPSRPCAGLSWTSSNVSWFRLGDVATRTTGRAANSSPKARPRSWQATARCSQAVAFGGAEGIRTPDPLHAMEVRYQLRHSPSRSLVRCPVVGTRVSLSANPRD
jgi:hypothetical protein